MGKTITTGFLAAKINGILINTSKPCRKGNYTNDASRLVEYVVMHYTGNSKDTAWANANYFQNNEVEASAHFFVDNSEIYQIAELRDIAWHCGTSGTYYHSKCRNANSFGIEMCCTAGNYKISETTKKNAAYLCADLCKRIGITADKVDTYVLRHYDVTHKECPAQMAGANNSEWKAFKDMVRNILKTGKATSTGTTTSTAKPQTTKKYDKALSGTYKTTADLYMRTGAGTSNKAILIIPQGKSVKCSGYYAKDSSGTKWLYVTYNGKSGYSSSAYLKKSTTASSTAKKPDVIYQVYAGGKWWDTITNYNTVDSNGYAGVFGKEISGIRVKLSNGKTVTVRSHISGKSTTDWLSAVTKWDNTSEGYSGWKGKPTDCIAMKASGHTLKYRVHVKGGGWLDWITKYDITDYENGLAGAYGKPIDAVQITVV